MNLFQGFLEPKNNHNQSSQNLNKSTTQPKQRMIKLTSLQDEEDMSSDNFDPKLILRAMNNSFTKRMSDHYEEVEFTDIFTMISEFGLKLHHRQSLEETDISIQKWCIVALDEKNLEHSGIGNFGSPINTIFSFCGNSKTEKVHEISIHREN